MKVSEGFTYYILLVVVVTVYGVVTVVLVNDLHDKVDRLSQTLGVVDMAEKRLVKGWDSVDEFIGAGDLTLLSSDGETVLFFVMGEPVGMTSAKFGTDSKRAVLPILTADGLSAIPLNARTYRKITRQREGLKDHAVQLTRHGAEGDTGTTYEVQLVDIPDDMKGAEKAFKPAEVAASLQSALDILSQAR